MPGAVYLHSTWRSSSTYVWAKFRDRAPYWALFEPLAEHLAVADDAVLAGFRWWPASNHPVLDRPYQDEFRPLLKPGGGVPGFPTEDVYGRYLLDEDADCPALAAYFAGLTGLARQIGRIPVFGLVRSSQRIGWFRRHCPGVHIGIRRDPRRVFLSCLRLAADGNRYFLDRPMVILGRNRDDPRLAMLKGLVRPAPADLPRERLDDYYAAQARQAEPATLFTIFYVLSRLGGAEMDAHCDFVLDVDGVAADADRAREAERRIAELTGAALSFADCRPNSYEDEYGWSAPFFDDFETRISAIVTLPGAQPVEASEADGEDAALSGDDVDALVGRGLKRERQGRLAEAEALLRRALERQPQGTAVLARYCGILLRLGRYDDAVVGYRLALDRNPGDIGLECDLAYALFKAGEREESERRFLAVLARSSDPLRCRSRYGAALRGWRRPAEALVQLRHVVELAPEDADGWDDLGRVYMELGRVGEAVAALERAVALPLARPHHFHTLTETRRMVAGEPAMAAMAAMAAQVDSLPVDDRIDLHFALGKALDDIGDYPRAFDHFRQGNALKRLMVAYDEDLAFARLHRIRGALSADVIGRLSGLGLPSARPIFIVGMPRSGTTLIEQSLASHPEIAAPGELDAFERSLTARFGARFPGPLSEADAEDIGGLGAAYLAQLEAEAALLGRPRAPRIIDKMPNNFVYAGMIHLALPQARIIRVRRDPVDTCMSCYSKLFVDSQLFAWDLGELGRYWRAAEHHMDYWRRVLPPEIYLEVDYEAVVADLEGQVRRILAHCGLDWHPACLDFHRTVRPVRTASWEQVRRPLYADSVGRWRRNYGAALAPLLEGLAG